MRNSGSKTNKNKEVNSSKLSFVGVESNETETKIKSLEVAVAKCKLIIKKSNYSKRNIF